MLVDMEAEPSRRACTSDLVSCPATATKPINSGRWFDLVHVKREYFVANTAEDIAKVQFDHELNAALGWQSVVNVPFVIKDEVVGYMNLLHVAGYYTPERLRIIRHVLSVPAKLAVLAAR